MTKLKLVITHFIEALGYKCHRELKKSQEYNGRIFVKMAMSVKLRYEKMKPALFKLLDLKFRPFYFFAMLKMHGTTMEPMAEEPCTWSNTLRRTLPTPHSHIGCTWKSSGKRLYAVIVLLDEDVLKW